MYEKSPEDMDKKWENAGTHWTEDEELKVIEYVNKEGSMLNGVYRASEDIKRSPDAIISRFTFTRLYCEKAINRILKGHILAGLIMISGFQRPQYYPKGLFEFHLEKTIERYGKEKVFSKNVLTQEVKNELKDSIEIFTSYLPRAQHARNIELSSNLLIDKNG